jgi:hypothetical protein
VSNTAVPSGPSVSAPNVVPPSWNVTYPRGAGPLEVTAACNRIVWLVIACTGVMVRLVVVE